MNLGPWILVLAIVRAGAIPPQLGQLTALTVLNLACNHLTGEPCLQLSTFLAALPVTRAVQITDEKYVRLMPAVQITL